MQLLVGCNSDEPLMNYEDSKVKLNGMVATFAFFIRWFKFTLKPPYSIALDNLRLAIWDTSFWTFWLKFGHKGP